MARHIPRAGLSAEPGLRIGCAGLGLDAAPHDGAGRERPLEVVRWAAEIHDACLIDAMNWVSWTEDDRGLGGSEWTEDAAGERGVGCTRCTAGRQCRPSTQVSIMVGLLPMTAHLLPSASCSLLHDTARG